MAIDRLTAGTGRMRVVFAATWDVLLAVRSILAVELLINVFVLVQTMNVFDNFIQLADHLQILSLVPT